MKQRGWPDINGWFVIGAILATLRAWWGKNQAPAKPVAKILPFTGTILDQGQKQAGELAAKVTTDGQSVSGEASVKAGGDSWWVRFLAKVTAERDKKPDVAAEVEFQKRWFGGW